MSEPSRQLVVPWLSVCIFIFPSRSRIQAAKQKFDDFVDEKTHWKQI